MMRDVDSKVRFRSCHSFLRARVYFCHAYLSYQPVKTELPLTRADLDFSSTPLRRQLRQINLGQHLDACRRDADSDFASSRQSKPLFRFSLRLETTLKLLRYKMKRNGKPIMTTVESRIG